jgi:hypothetical protein
MLIGFDYEAAKERHVDRQLNKPADLRRTHITNRSWTEADINRLKELSRVGASIVRAAASLNRKTTAVAKMARLHNISLAGTRTLKAAIRALDEKHPS